MNVQPPFLRSQKHGELGVGTPLQAHAYARRYCAAPHAWGVAQMRGQQQPPLANTPAARQRLKTATQRNASTPSTRTAPSSAAVQQMNTGAPAQHHKHGCSQHHGVAQQHPALLQQPPAVLVVRILAAPLRQALRRLAQQCIEGESACNDGQEQPGGRGSRVGWLNAKRAVRLWRCGTTRGACRRRQGARGRAPCADRAASHLLGCSGQLSTRAGRPAAGQAGYSLADRGGVENDGATMFSQLGLQRGVLGPLPAVQQPGQKREHSAPAWSACSGL